MKYERLTNGLIESFEKGRMIVDCNYELSDCNDSCVYGGYKCRWVEKALYRLAELEDKIEQGTLIELPCKVGDTMYKLCSVNSRIEMGQMWDGKIVKTNCNRCAYEFCPCYDIGLRERDKPFFIDVIEEKKINRLEFLVKIIPYVGTIWFTTREEAEKKLKELQNV